MPDLQQGLAGNHHHGFNQAYQTNNNSHDSTRLAEFEFWEAEESKDMESVGDFGISEVEFQVQTQNGDGFDAYSPPLWKTGSGIKNEVHPLLPRGHRCNNVSPRSRMQAIAKGRRELMEIVQNMPESSYELSLRDIVDRDMLQEAGQQIAAEDTRLDFKTGVQIQQQKKKKKQNIKPCQLSRSGSMDNTTFLLKMFFPASLTVKNSTTGKRAKVTSRSASFEGTERRTNKEWWRKRFSIAEDSVGSGRSSSDRSSSNSNRHADSNFLPGCWPFFQTKKSKTWRQRGCIF